MVGGVINPLGIQWVQEAGCGAGLSGVVSEQPDKHVHLFFVFLALFSCHSVGQDVLLCRTVCR